MDETDRNDGPFAPWKIKQSRPIHEPAGIAADERHILLRWEDNENETDEVIAAYRVFFCAVIAGKASID